MKSILMFVHFAQVATEKATKCAQVYGMNLKKRSEPLC